MLEKILFSSDVQYSRSSNNVQVDQSKIEEVLFETTHTMKQWCSRTKMRSWQQHLRKVQHPRFEIVQIKPQVRIHHSPWLDAQPNTPPHCSREQNVEEPDRIDEPCIHFVPPHFV